MSAEPDLKPSEAEPDENRFQDLWTWTVIPALPGTRIEWKAEWCESGWLLVHAWLIKLDVIGRRYDPVDTSCVIGQPMILNANQELQPAAFADLDGKPGEILEP